MAPKTPRPGPFCPTLLLLLLFPATSFAAGDLYWADNTASNRRIQHCDVAGCTPSDFATGLDPSPTGDIDIDAVEGMVYWAINTTGGTSKIQRRSLSGGAVEDIFSLLSVPSSNVTGIAIDPAARQVYVATPNSSARIRRFSIDSPGSTPVTVVAGNESGCPCTPQGLALDLAGGLLYWADSTGGAVRRKALDLASPLQDFVTGLSAPTALALDVANDRVYFSQTGPSRISYAALSSPGTVVDLASPLSTNLFAGGLERDPSAGTLGELYFALSGDNEIRHCAIDAGCPSPQTLLTSGMVDNRGLALLPAGPAGVPALGPYGYLLLAAFLAGSALRERRRAGRRPMG